MFRHRDLSSRSMTWIFKSAYDAWEVAEARWEVKAW
jgi:hypothetical protein